MTKLPQIYLPTEELELLLSERKRIFAERAATQADYEQIEVLGRSLPDDMDSTSIHPTRLPNPKFDNPVDEMHETLKELRAEIASIQQLSDIVQSTTAEIAQREKQRVFSIIAGIVGGFLFLCFLLSLLLSFIG